MKSSFDGARDAEKFSFKSVFWNADLSVIKEVMEEADVVSAKWKVELLELILV